MKIERVRFRSFESKTDNAMQSDARTNYEKTGVMDLSEKRKEYSLDSIDVDTVDECPFVQFEAWFKRATESDVTEPNASILATVDEKSQPTQRTVLLKYFDKQGFVFFTNYGSRKAKHIKQNEHVSLLFPWFQLQRQLEITGTAKKIPASESLKYFASRPRGSQIGAWVSQQSSVVTTGSLLRNKFAELKQKFAGGEIPIPSFWGGYRVAPVRFEFWQGRPNRLHDRIEYLPSDNGTWHRQRLAP